MTEESAALVFFKSVHRVHLYMHRLFHEKMHGEYTSIEMMIAHNLKDREGIKTSDLAQKIGLAPSTLTGTLDRMEQRELIIRERGREDRRVVTIYRGQKFIQFARVMEELVAEVQEQLAADFDEAWWQDMAQEMQRLTDSFPQQDRKSNGKK